MDRPLIHTLAEFESIVRTLFRGLLASLLLLADGYALIIISRQLGVYLLLAILASTGFVGVVAILANYRSTLDRMWRVVTAGRYPRTEFRRMSSLLVAAALLLIPGFVSDAVGIVLLTRLGGWILGAIIEHRNRQRFAELYEYLRLRR